MRLQCALAAATANLGCINKSIASSTEGCSYTTLPGHTWNTVFSFGLCTFKRDKEKLERIQCRAIKMTRIQDMPWYMKKG